MSWQYSGKLLIKLWDECLDTKLELDIKGIIGVKTQMSHYKLLFGLHLCERILKITDNLSKTLQMEKLSAQQIDCSNPKKYENR